MTSASKPQYFSLREFIRLSWRFKWFIIVLTAVFAAASVFIVLSIPNQYESQVLVAPSEEQQGGGLAALANQFGGLASLAGINLGGKGGDNTLMALAVFRSKRFLMHFIDKNELLVPLMAANDWLPDTDELVINPKLYDVTNKKWVRKVSYPLQVKPTLLEAYTAFKERLGIDRDIKAGTITVSFQFYSPNVAQQWLTLLISEYNAHMLDQERRKSAKSIDYLSTQIENTQVAELKNVFFQLVQEQTKKAMLAEARDEFAFTTIDPAIAPEVKSKPLRALICVVITFLGGIFSLLLVHARHAFITPRREANMP
jgi:uncharacterized protein involved in exopolysaccharide biosynthesis